jgi:hypothetical protein
MERANEVEFKEMEDTLMWVKQILCKEHAETMRDSVITSSVAPLSPKPITQNHLTIIGKPWRSVPMIMGT